MAIECAEAQEWIEEEISKLLIHGPKKVRKNVKTGHGH